MKWQPKKEREDNWYLRNGVEPPKVDQHLTEDELRDIFSGLKGRVHGDWKQRGNQLTCHACSPEHGIILPTDVMLRETSPKGLPVLEKFRIATFE